jgi:hypothetical protein
MAARRAESGWGHAWPKIHYPTINPNFATFGATVPAVEHDEGDGEGGHGHGIRDPVEPESVVALLFARETNADAVARHHAVQFVQVLAAGAMIRQTLNV